MSVSTFYPSSIYLLHLTAHLIWIHSQYVVVSGSIPPPPYLLYTSGVPQGPGSIFAPLLFLVCINGVTDIPLTISSNLTLYANDIFLISIWHVPSPIWSRLHFLLAFFPPSSAELIIFSSKPPSYFDVHVLLSLSISSSPIECFILPLSWCSALIHPLLGPPPPPPPDTLHLLQILPHHWSHLPAFLSPFLPLYHHQTLCLSHLPHLEYCSAIWAPSSPSLCCLVELWSKTSVQIPSIPNVFHTIFSTLSLSSFS